MSAASPLTGQEILRHYLAALAYRATRVLEGAPGDFAEHAAGSGVRSPREILAHISTVLEYAHAYLTGAKFQRTEPGAWETEIERFYETVGRMDGLLGGSMPSDPELVLRAVQGPLADALTHVGQLATLRRLAGAPVPAENYFKAAIQAGRVGRDQPEPAR